MDDQGLIRKSNKGMRLNMELGSQLGVSFEGAGQPFKAILMGLEPLNYLILKIALPKEFRSNLKKGARLDIKYLSLGSEYGFTTEVIDHIESPFILTFISYPSKVESLDARSRTRVCCYIPATATLNEKNVKGTITDISTNGCRFVIKLPVNLQPRQVMLIDQILLYFPIMGLQGLQVFQGRVKNTTIDKEKIAMGIEFLDLKDELQQSIADYITSVAEISSIEAIKL